ncbi:MAG: MFS transporter [SAR202 cluster bacterium]|nr:MFS transporter [SAR202 cluster bacterium]
MINPSIADGPSLGRGRRVGIVATMALALTLSTMSLTVAFVSLRQIAESLGTSIAWAGWTVTAYQLAQSVSMALMGKLGEQLGRRRLFLIACVALLAGNIGAAWAPTIGVHILMRTIAALGAGSFLPLSVGIVSRHFPRQRTMLVGSFFIFFPLGWLIGAPTAGAIIDAVAWRWVFFMPVPFAALALAMALLFIPESKGETRHRIDLRGVALFTSTIIAFMLALSLMRGDYGLPAYAPFLLLVGALPLGFWFWGTEHRVEEPVVDPALIKSKPLIAANLFNFCFSAVGFATSSLVPLYSVEAFGFSNSASGAVLIGLETAVVTGAMVTSFVLLGRFSNRSLMFVGALLLSSSLLMMGSGVGDVRIAGVAVSAFWVLTAIQIPSGIGFGLMMAPSANSGTDLFPGKLASIVGLRNMFRQAGGVVLATLMFFYLAGASDWVQGVRFLFLLTGAAMIPVGFLALLTPGSAARRASASAASASERPNPARQ